MGSGSVGKLIQLIPYSVEVAHSAVVITQVATAMNSIKVQGSVLRHSGNQFPTIGPKAGLNPPNQLANTKVLAVPGLVKAEPGSPFISLQAIPKSAQATQTNEAGDFSFSLTPGIYTFFIVIDNKAYRNGFTAEGNFMPTTVTEPINNLQLIDNRFAFY